MSIGRFKERIIDEQLGLSCIAFRHRAIVEIPIDMGDILISGIPCVDFSTHCANRGLDAPSGLLIIVRIRLMRLHVPAILIIEEVKPFPKKRLSLLLREDLLGGMLFCSQLSALISAS